MAASGEDGDCFGDDSLFDAFFANKETKSQNSDKNKTLMTALPQNNRGGKKRKSTDDGNCESENCANESTVVKKKKKDEATIDENVREKCAPFVVRFRSEDLYKKYSSRISRFLQQIASESDFPSTTKHDEPVEMEIHGSFSFDVQREIEEESPETTNVSYDMVYEGVLQIGQKKEEVKQVCGSKQKSKVMCFNCMGGHNLRECPAPKNYQVINQNKMDFMKNKTSTPKSSRYHLELDETSGRSTVVPGNISWELRDALGLRENDLPPYIYSMRVLGYPPGWLEEAKVEGSGLTIINNCVTDEAEGDPPSVQYDFAKVHDYPGFNVWSPRGTLDLAYAKGYPPIMPHHLKTNWEKQLQGQLYKRSNRSKAPLTESTSTKTSRSPSVQPCVPGEEQSTPIKLKRRGPMFLPPCKSEKNESVQSLSLDELEVQRNKLLEELDESPSTSGVSTPERSRSPPAADFGTPIPQHENTSAQIPEMEKFSKNVTDYIPFENLPGYTGKYKEMKGLLKKVRRKVKEMQDSSD